MKLRFSILILFLLVLMCMPLNSGAADKTVQTERKPSVPQKKTSRRYQSRRTKTSVPKKGRSSRSGGKHYGSTYNPPIFDLEVDEKTSVLYFYPPDRNVKVGAGDFNIFVIFSNPRVEYFDRVFLAIRYDPVILQPLDYEDMLPSELLKEPPKVLIHPKEGILTFKAELKEPYCMTDEELLAITWRALLPQKNTILSFTSFNDQESGLYFKDMNILGDPSVPGDGVIPGSINADNLIDTEEEMDEEYLHELVVDKISHQKGSGDGSINLSLNPDKSFIKKGDLLLVDIIFKNPKGVFIDNIDLDIRFDPRVFQVVDYDDENWITRDINIFDGLYHEDFPFDYHLKNRAYNRSGRIIYKMGVSKSDLLHRSGTMATIKFYAHAPAEKSSIAFYRPERKRELLGTVITYAGRDVLGLPTERNFGIKNASVTVIGD